jgi:hypothetical protein
MSKVDLLKANGIKIVDNKVSVKDIPKIKKILKKDYSEKYINGEDYTEEQLKGIKTAKDINISNEGLTKLPDMSHIKVSGDFHCMDNDLTSLQGAPKEVGGSFDKIILE